MRSAVPPALPTTSTPRRWPSRATLAVTGALVVTSLASGLGPATASAPTAGASVATSARLVMAAAKKPQKKDDNATPNPVTPADFTGYAFDQCLAPTQGVMDTWLNTSPFLGVGIYISGDSRACRSQPNLTPTWVRTQLAHGWRLLPITMGPQASCQPRFPRYKDDFKISPAPGKGAYEKARMQGRTNASQSVADATRLGITAGSTLWYDLEGFDSSNTACRESALSFLSGWVYRVHQKGFKAGVYSSAGSGIAALDDARVNRPRAFKLPDQIWLARWDGQANTSSDYIRDDGWRPGNRIKQFQGGHDETYGGVTINIDRDWLDVGAGSNSAPREDHCGVKVNFKDYVPLAPAASNKGTAPPRDQVTALQCLLQERGYYKAKISGYYNQPLMDAAMKWQKDHKFYVDLQGRWWRRDWMSLLTAGDTPVLKRGSTGPYVRRVQRALNATDLGIHLNNTGVFSGNLNLVVQKYQGAVGLQQSGIVNPNTWAKLRAGVR